MNRLAREASPYLREHAENPVDWYPWGPEAWARAKEENRPVFLSVGYAACHWCHVMAEESFSDPETAKLLNDNFVCVKVDREELPEVDEVYVDAVRLLTGSAGWPLSVFLTPDRRPFYGGSYFPPESRLGLPAFRDVLASVLHHFRAERSEVEMASRTIATELERLSAPGPGEPDSSALARYHAERRESFDARNGGFGTAPKFPMPSDLLLLLRLARRPGFDRALAMVELSLEKMAAGGIHDQLAGGFHRYSTDSVWLVPHFEKMLYDNALLAQAYLAAFRLTRKELYREVAESTLDFMLRELGAPEAGFYSSLDADSPEGEGRYYLWTQEEFDRALGSDAALGRELFGVSALGSFHSMSVLHLARGRPGVLPRLRERLLAARSRRRPPRVDDKVLANWNGLALSALADAGRTLGRADYLEAATSLARFIAVRMMDGPDLMHFLRPGQPAVPGRLADYAFVCLGLLDLYAAGFDPEHLGFARRLADRMVELFYEPGQGFFSTPPGGSGLFIRPRSGYDGAIPSGASVAVQALLRLGRLTAESRYEAAARDALESNWAGIARCPSAGSAMLLALDLLLSPGSELVLFLPAGPGPWLDVLRRHPDPYRTELAVFSSGPDRLTSSLSGLVHGRGALGGRATAWLCRNKTCLEPVRLAGRADLEALIEHGQGRDPNHGSAARRGEEHERGQAGGRVVPPPVSDS